MRKRKNRVCITCGADISRRLLKADFCKLCSRERERQYHKQIYVIKRQKELRKNGKTDL